MTQLLTGAGLTIALMAGVLIFMILTNKKGTEKLFKATVFATIIFTGFAVATLANAQAPEIQETMNEDNSVEFYDRVCKPFLEADKVSKEIQEKYQDDPQGLKDYKHNLETNQCPFYEKRIIEQFGTIDIKG